ncbi:glycoside hydrolase [Rhypophila decipiens]
MHTTNHFIFMASLLGGLGAVVSARDVPSNLKTFYNQVASQGACKNKLATGFFSTDDGPGDVSYCSNTPTSPSVIYLKASGKEFTNMDIDCDGVQNGPPVNDKRCFSSEDTQAITSFQDIVAGYNKGIDDLNAKIHSYVVFGNSGSKPGWKTFDPAAHGVKPLSVMAVVCGNKLFYGIWGDTNGDDGDHPLVGETSLALATACYGQSMNGNNGHDENDVLYIAFPGADAVPGANGAQWNAGSFDEFEKSIGALGDRLVAARIGANGLVSEPAAGNETTSSPGAPATTGEPVASEAGPARVRRASWGYHGHGRKVVKERRGAE